MSMLTPPGMGGEYRITGDRYPRMRRPRGRRRLVLGSLATVAALGLAAWGTVQLVDVFTGGGGSTRVSAAASECKPSVAPAEQSGPERPEAVPEPDAVTVNVYNATTRSGLAQKTADALEKRGFTIGEIDNAPPELDKKVKTTGLLFGTPESREQGALAVLAAHLEDDPKVETDAAREGKAAKSVDLVLGDKWKALTAPKSAARAVAALAEPAPSPSATPC